MALIGAAALASTAVEVTAQTVRGAVLDASTSRPVPGARVLLVDLSGRGTLQATSGSDGGFSLSASRGGRFTLEVEALGYLSWVSEPLTLGGGESVDLIVRVGVDAIPLQPIEVVAEEAMRRGRIVDFERRRDDPSLGGHYLGAEEIASRPMATPTQLLRAMPSVTLGQIQLTPGAMGLDRSLVYLPGRGIAAPPGLCLAQLFVNGVPVRQDPSGRLSVDDVLDGSPIVGIEVYPRASSAPLQYRTSELCGVVLYWTAEPEPEDNAGWGLGRMGLGIGLVGALITLAIIG